MSSDHVPSKYMPGTAECETCHKQRIDFQVRFDENKVMHADYGACPCGAEAYTKSYKGTKIV